MSLNKMSDLLRIPFGYRKLCHWTNGFGKQEPVHTKEQIYDFVDKYLGIENLGLSICSYIGEVPYLLFIPFDFDSESNRRLAWVDAVKLYNHLVDLNYDVRLTDSGRKGFHVYIATVPKPYGKECLRAFQKWFIKKLDLKTADIQILGDEKRIMRLPYTYNIRGHLCKEIAYNPGVPIEIDDLLLAVYNSKPTTYSRKDLHDMPCIEDLVRTDPEPRELIRLSYVALRLSKGWSEDEIIDEMKRFDWIDFDEELCRRKVQYINDGEYVPLGCNKIKEMGHCKEDCIYNNGNINKSLEELGII